MGIYNFGLCWTAESRYFKKQKYTIHFAFPVFEFNNITCELNLVTLIIMLSAITFVGNSKTGCPVVSIPFCDFQEYNYEGCTNETEQWKHSHVLKKLLSNIA